MRTQDVIAVFGTLQAVGEIFTPPISKSAVSQWGDEVPELREYQIREQFPDIDAKIDAARKTRKPRKNGHRRAA